MADSIHQVGFVQAHLRQFQEISSRPKPGQDLEDHTSTDGVVSQVRSSDQGKTWRLGGVVYGERKEDHFGRNPALLQYRRRTTHVPK